MRTVAEEWEEFKAHTIPAEAGAVQIAESKKIFYAGIFTAITKLGEIAKSYDELVACGKLEQVMQECREELTGPEGPQQKP